MVLRISPKSCVISTHLNIASKYFQNFWILNVSNNNNNNSLFKNKNLLLFCSQQKSFYTTSTIPTTTTTTTTTTAEISEEVRQYYEGIKNRNRYYLAKAITLVESTRKDHKEKAQQLLSMILTNTQNISNNNNYHHHHHHKPTTYRIGLSGPPGVGKSTFIERFGMYILSQNHRVSVLAVDPSSSRTGGSILADKTRMSELSQQEDAYIRPSPSRGALGGVARNTSEAIILCEAAGYDVCIIETVGVGQSEIMVADIVDMFVLMVPPAGGDEIQGLKKGIVEISDLVIVNKADGPLANSAKEAAAEYTSALKYLNPVSTYWKPRVISISSKTNMGIENVWNTIMEFFKIMNESGELQRRRGDQRTLWMWRQIKSILLDRLKEDEFTRKLVNVYEKKVLDGEMTFGAAANNIVDRFMNKCTVI
ncbi:hypothetical protein Glove_74g110 [Diversispora epigaea]|uniref:AAA+ ATPase domain-containing protein n=1 Tax=Diversispora epigaea TaxID=1348612 RepID=A0A397JDI6_9GLOM|nr:hypothetical protein Glove_74g110 [Diversispora epigaea]